MKHKMHTKHIFVRACVWCVSGARDPMRVFGIQAMETLKLKMLIENTAHDLWPTPVGIYTYRRDKKNGGFISYLLLHFDLIEWQCLVLACLGNFVFAMAEFNNIYS